MIRYCGECGGSVETPFCPSCGAPTGRDLRWQAPAKAAGGADEYRPPARISDLRANEAAGVSANEQLRRKQAAASYKDWQRGDLARRQAEMDHKASRETVQTPEQAFAAALRKKLARRSLLYLWGGLTIMLFGLFSGYAAYTSQTGGRIWIGGIIWGPLLMFRSMKLSGMVDELDSGVSVASVIARMEQRRQQRIRRDHRAMKALAVVVGLFVVYLIVLGSLSK